MCLFSKPYPILVFFPQELARCECTLKVVEALHRRFQECDIVLMADCSPVSSNKVGAIEKPTGLIGDRCTTLYLNAHLRWCVFAGCLAMALSAGMLDNQVQ